MSFCVSHKLFHGVLNVFTDVYVTECKEMALLGFLAIFLTLIEIRFIFYFI